MKLSKEDPILIIGASISGLFLSWALRHYGFTNVQVLDRQAQPFWSKGAITLGPQVLNALGQLERSGEFEKIGEPWKQMEMRWSSDEVFHRFEISKVKEPTGFFPISVSATELRELLTKGLTADTLKPGHEFISFTQSEKEIEAHFSQGQTLKGGLLIAADGMESRVRLQMIGKTEQEATGLTTWRALIPGDKVPAELRESLKSVHKEFIGPGVRSSFFALKEGQVGLECTTTSTTVPKTQEQEKEYLIEKCSEMPEPIPQLLELVQPQFISARQHVERPLQKSSFANRVVLIGDSAQPALPYLGIEHNLGILDALILAQQLDQGKSLRRALPQFDRLHKQHAKRFQQAGARYDRAVAVDQKFPYFFRKMIYPMKPWGKVYSPFYKIGTMTL